MEGRQPLAPELVKDFVGSAHSDLDRVKQLLEQEPGLLHAANDWGGGDWETALGAAAHMGRKDIAHFLLEQGARIDVFAAAMLGKIAFVKLLLEDDPALARSLGPHGIPLIQHAKAGGDEAAELVPFIEALLA